MWPIPKPHLDTIEQTDCLITDLGDPAVRMLAVWAHLIISTPHTDLDIDIDRALAAIERGHRARTRHC